MSMKRSLYKRLGMWDTSLDMPTMGGCLATLGAIIVLALGVGLTLSWTIKSRNCAYASTRFDRPTHYDLLAGCYISIGDHQSIPLGQWNGFRTVK